MQDFDPKRVHLVQRSILFRFLNRFEEIREICAIREGIPVLELINNYSARMAILIFGYLNLANLTFKKIH